MNFGRLRYLRQQGAALLGLALVGIAYITAHAVLAVRDFFEENT